MIIEVNFCNKQLAEILQDSDIVHPTIISFTPEQNGRTERLNRSILERDRCLLFEADLPNKFLAETVFNTVYLMNPLPRRYVDKTPNEMWSGRKHTVRHIKVFGCKAFAHIPYAY